MTDISVMGERQVAGVGGTRPLRNVSGEALEGRFSFEARNYLFSVQSYVRFEEFFVSRAFERFGAKCSSSGAFGFDDVFGVFLKTPLPHRAFLRPWVFLKISFLFFKAVPVLLAWELWRSPGWAKHFGDGTSKTRMKLDFGALARSSAEGPSIVVAIGTSRVPWSMAQERKKIKEVSVCVRRLNHSSSTNPQVTCWGASFRDQMLQPFSHFVVLVVVDVQLLVGQAAARGKRRKAVIRDTSGVDHWGVTNLTTPIWFTGQGHCTVFRQVIIAVGSVLEKHFDGDFTRAQRKEITFKRWPLGYQSWKLGLALNGLNVAWIEERRHFGFL